jgi:transposase InsO family protein
MHELSERITFDHTDLNEGCKIFTVIDHFSKYAFGEIVPNKSTGHVVRILQKFLEFLGVDAKIFQSDNVKEFDSELLKDWISDIEGVLVHDKPYYPQSQSVIEKLNKTVKNIINGSNDTELLIVD